MTPNILYSKSKFHWLRDYPEKPNPPFSEKSIHPIAWASYDQAVASSLASALEFVEEDQETLMRFVTGTGTINGKWGPQVDRHGVQDGQLFTVEGIEVTEPEWHYRGH